MTNDPPNDKTFIEIYKCDVNFDFLKNTRPYLFDAHINSNTGRRKDFSVKKCKEIGVWIPMKQNLYPIVIIYKYV